VVSEVLTPKQMPYVSAAAHRKAVERPIAKNTSL
jgi:hypothetical protein